MKHSTCYKDKGVRRIYTTVSLTGHHAFLRESYDGITYKHYDDAVLYFIYPSMPLDAPLTYSEVIR